MSSYGLMTNSRKPYSFIRRLSRDYYKFTDSYNLVNIGDSDNTTYVVNGVYTIDSVTDWSATTEYKFNSLKQLSKIKNIIDVPYAQANCGWTTTITALTSLGEVQIYSKDFGYGVQTVEDNIYGFNTPVSFYGIRIYANCYRRSNLYCYGSIKISTYVNTIVSGTSSSYDYYLDTNKYYGLMRK